MRNDFWYHSLIFGMTCLVTQVFFGTFLAVYKSTNVHRKLEPHYRAELAYKRKMAELEALEEDDDDEDDDEDEDEDDE
jgi:hypothetical protein